MLFKEHLLLVNLIVKYDYQTDRCKTKLHLYMYMLINWKSKRRITDRKTILKIDTPWSYRDGRCNNSHDSSSVLHCFCDSSKLLSVCLSYPTPKLIYIYHTNTHMTPAMSCTVSATPPSFVSVCLSYPTPKPIYIYPTNTHMTPAVSCTVSETPPSFVSVCLSSRPGRFENSLPL